MGGKQQILFAVESIGCLKPPFVYCFDTGENFKYDYSQASSGVIRKISKRIYLTN